MTEFAGIFEVLAADQSDARLASRRALVLSRNRLDTLLGKFLLASRSATEFDARYDLVSDDFAGIIRVAAQESGHDDPDSLITTLRNHYRTAGKPPWLEDDDNEEETEEPKSKKDKKKDKHKDEDSDADDGDDSLEFTAVYKQAERYFTCPRCGHQQNHPSGVDDPDKCENCGNPSLIEHDSPESQDDDSSKRDSSTHIADEKGNTGLAGPSPAMDKKRWTPKSVKPIDVPSGRHPTVQKDVTEIMPKNNLTGPAHDLEEVNALTTVETLPIGKGLDDAGFAGNNQDMAPHTKTFGNGDQTKSVTQEALASIHTADIPSGHQLCPKCGGQGCLDCKGLGWVPMTPAPVVPDNARTEWLPEHVSPTAPPFRG